MHKCSPFSNHNVKSQVCEVVEEMKLSIWSFHRQTIFDHCSFSKLAATQSDWIRSFPLVFPPCSIEIRNQGAWEIHQHLSFISLKSLDYALPLCYNIDWPLWAWKYEAHEENLWHFSRCCNIWQLQPSSCQPHSLCRHLLNLNQFLCPINWYFCCIRDFAPLYIEFSKYFHGLL